MRRARLPLLHRQQVLPTLPIGRGWSSYADDSVWSLTNAFLSIALRVLATRVLVKTFRFNSWSTRSVWVSPSRQEVFHMGLRSRVGALLLGGRAGGSAASLWAGGTGGARPRVRHLGRRLQSKGRVRVTQPVCTCLPGGLLAAAAGLSKEDSRGDTIKRGRPIATCLRIIYVS